MAQTEDATKMMQSTPHGAPLESPKEEGAQSQTGTTIEVSPSELAIESESMNDGRAEGAATVFQSVAGDFGSNRANLPDSTAGGISEGAQGTQSLQKNGNEVESGIHDISTGTQVRVAGSRGFPAGGRPFGPPRAPLITRPAFWTFLGAASR